MNKAHGKSYELTNIVSSDPIYFDLLILKVPKSYLRAEEQILCSGCELDLSASRYCPVVCSCEQN